MALFVFGAGATRGCSFVEPKKDSCLPPLDSDFFTQLQRVQNSKHYSDIGQVMIDVVDMFGNNFAVTMETVFTTLEHTIRMIDVTGDNRAFKKDDLEQRRERLKQAIAFVFEDSLTIRSRRGGSTLKPRQCTYHNRLVKDILQGKDKIIGFNYDCVLDYALKQSGDGKWNPHYGYGFNLGSRGHRLTGDVAWQPTKVAPKEKTVYYYKLHGSLHFDFDVDDVAAQIKLKAKPYTKQAGHMRFAIIPPEWNKTFSKGHFSDLWQKAAEAISDAEHIIFIGYSLPTTDLHASSLFRTSISKRKPLKAIVVVNPDREARKRTRLVLQAGLKPPTKVLSFESLAEFVITPRSVWAV